MVLIPKEFLMASKDVEVMLVKKSFLEDYSESCPEAFRAYVLKFFEPINLFGVDCMFAFLDSGRPSPRCSYA